MKRGITLLTLVVALTLSAFGAARSTGARPSGPTAKSDTTEANLVHITTTLLEESQFSHHPIDRDLAKKWLDTYLDALDTRHALFLQSDIDDFGRYLPTLLEATRGEGKTEVPQTIFARF